MWRCVNGSCELWRYVDGVVCELWRYVDGVLCVHEMKLCSTVTSSLL